MKIAEVCGDIWEFDCLWRVIPTNCYVKKDGTAVMGAGLARQAALKHPNLPEVLGRSLGTNGPSVVAIRHDLIAFPVKYHWLHPAVLELIERSTRELFNLADKMEWNHIAIPHVGCGNGQLNWKDVKPILEFWLDSRFTIVDRGDI